MTTLFAYLILFQIIVKLFFKTDYSVAYCGIAGFSGVKGLTKEQEVKILRNLKFLAICNQTRGEDGCGLYLNGQIYKGFDDVKNKVNTKKALDFFANFPLEQLKYDSTNYPNMIFHARKSTYGAHTYNNTHPFYIESVNGKKNDIVLVHNGTIEKIWEMCREHDLKITDYDVDSHALAAMMDKSGVEKVLTTYKGAAALMWTKPADSATMYVFHGASKKTANGENYEERPMCYLKTAEGIYFSSMAESLWAISENPKDKVYDLEYNAVIKVTNGKFVSKKEIPRENANVWVAPVVHRNTYVPPAQSTQKPAPFQEQLPFPNTTLQTVTGNKGPVENLIYKETKPTESFDSGRVFFYHGRYYLGSLLISGAYLLSAKGFVLPASSPEGTFYYFYAGVLLKNKEAYEAVDKISKDANSFLYDKKQNFAFFISQYAETPVTNMDGDYTDGGTTGGNYWKHAFYLDKHRVAKPFTPKFSKRAYHISAGGFLTNINSSDKTNDKNPLSVSNSKTDNISNFDIVFSTLDELKQNLTMDEKAAVQEYIKEKLSAASVVDPIPEEIQQECLSTYRKCINLQKSLRVVLEDDRKELEVFIELLERNNVEPVIGNSDLPQMTDDEFFQIYGYHMDSLNFPKDDSSDNRQEDVVENIFIDDDHIKREAVKEKIEELINQISIISEIATELKVYDDDLSQKVAQTISSSLNSLKYNIAEDLIENDETQLANYLNRTVNETL